MWSRQYSIAMQTPIGARYGTVTVVADGERLSGCLNVLNRGNRFHGSIHSDGSCEIKGSIVTLMRTVPYTAAGRITEEALSLTLTGEQETFKVSGKAAADLAEQKTE